MANPYRNREQGRDRTNRGEERSGSDYGRSSGSGYGSNPYGRDEEYFGGQMQYGEGYGSGSNRDYGRYSRDYESGTSESQPGFGRQGNRGSEYDGGTYRRSGGYSQGFGSEASRRQSGVGYSGRSGYGGDEYLENRYSSRYAGHGAEEVGLSNYPESERGFGRDYGNRSYGDGGRDRGWWDRTSDEVASWFGDEDAAKRRRMDSRGDGQHRGRGPSNYTRSDDRIKEDINDRLTDHSYLDASNVSVEATGGEVTLSGTVDNRYEKRLAEDVAEDVSGVRNVENRIRVNNTYSNSSSDRTSDAGTSMSTTSASKSTGASSRG